MDYDGVYICADGYDNTALAPLLTEPLETSKPAFDRKYRIVNDQFDPERDDPPDFLPEWNAGLNVESKYSKGASGDGSIT